MNHEIPIRDLILQRSPSLAAESYSNGSTFTLQDRVEAIEQSSEEFYDKVSVRSVWSTSTNMFSKNGKEERFGSIFWIKFYVNNFSFFIDCTYFSTRVITVNQWRKCGIQFYRKPNLDALMFKCLDFQWRTVIYLSFFGNYGNFNSTKIKNSTKISFLILYIRNWIVNL